MMKKFLCLLLAGLLAAGMSLPAFASDDVSGEDASVSTAADAAAGIGADSATAIDIPAKSGILMDCTTGKVLFEQDPHAKMAPASITKIMTMLLVMEAIERGELTLQDTVTASAHAASMGGTQIWLKENEQMSVHDLLKATAVASANDAAMALAEHIGGSEEGFVAMMNHRAAELGMNDTTFVNPTGLDAEGHVSSAYDIALMSRELLRHETITEYTSIWMDSLREGKTELVNTNKLVRFYKGCTGLKTGTTDDAGSCVSVSATRGDMSLIAVVMGCTTSNDRFSSARILLDHGFANYVMFEPQSAGNALPPVRVIGGTAAEVAAAAEGNGGRIILRKGKEKDVVEEIDLLPEVEAPVEAGQKLGEIRLTVDGTQIAVFPIVAQESVEKMTVFKAFVRLLTRLVSMG